MSEQPDYPNYTVEQLLEAKERIDAERFPENARRLEGELARRGTSQQYPQVLRPESSSPEPQLMGCVVVAVVLLLVTGAVRLSL